MLFNSFNMFRLFGNFSLSVICQPSSVNLFPFLSSANLHLSTFFPFCHLSNLHLSTFFPFCHLSTFICQLFDYQQVGRLLSYFNFNKMTKPFKKYAYSLF